jgi:DNA-binding GntR family transcriptional regulator
MRDDEASFATEEDFGVGAPEPSPVRVAGTDALAERVATEIGDMVIRGALRPGERIVERRLCEVLGVSRTPMREALKLLRHDGLIEISRNRGARVSPYCAEDARQLFEVIAALEGMAAAGFTRRAQPRSLERLEALHGRMMTLRREGRLDEYFDVNSAIHDLILSGAGNAVLAESHKRLMLRARRGRYMAIMDGARWDQAVREHEALIAAIRAGAAPAAEVVWREHLLNTGRAVISALNTARACEGPSPLLD